MNQHSSIMKVGPAIKKIYEVGVKPKNEDFHEFTNEIYEIYKEQGYKGSEKLYLWVPNNIKIEGEPLRVVSESEKADLFKADILIEHYSEKSTFSLENYEKKLKYFEGYLPKFMKPKREYIK